MNNTSWNWFTDKFGSSIFHPQYLIKKYTTSWLNGCPRLIKGKVLDLGCGRMEYKKDILQFANSYTGLDHPQISKLYKKEDRPDILADIHNLPVKNNSYDTVLLLQVLEYLENPSQAFSEIKRVLKKNGYLIATIPFLYPIHDYPFDRARYTDTQLKYFLSQNGFEKIKIIPQGNFFEFWILSFLVYYFKSVKKIFKQNVVRKIIATVLLISGVVLTPILNLLALSLSKISKDENTTYPINYLITSQKQLLRK